MSGAAEGRGSRESREDREGRDQREGRNHPEVRATREPVVTVVIPTRDRAELLPGVLGAILGQSLAELEVIVVDDGSTDHTPTVLAEAGADSRVRTLRHDHPRGAAAARNMGAAEARGQYLLFEDDDCISEPDKLERLTAALRRDPAAGYAYGWMRMRLPDGETRVYGGDGPWSISTSCALIRRDAFREVGGFDPELPRLQDFDLFTRLLGRYRAVEVPAVLLEMSRGDEGISASKERLVAAATRLLTKYRNAELASSHLSAMHRRLGGKLLMAGERRLGVAHFRASIRRCPWCPRSWAGFLAALAGPTVFRAVARISYGLGRWRRGAAPAYAPEPGSAGKGGAG
jgi:glycosyltransferase involved in cell wall biosynthesis